MRFKSIKSRLVFWFLVVALIPLVVLSMVTYDERVRDTKAVEYNKLTAIRNLKADQLNTWLDEVSSDIQNLSELQQVKKTLDEFIEDQGQKRKDGGLLDPLSEQLWSFVQHNRIFREIAVLSPGYGRVIASSNRESLGMDRSQEPYFLMPLRTGKLYRQDISLVGTQREPTLALSLPVNIFEHQRAQRVLGILVGYVDLKGSLYRLLMNRSGMGETGETFIIGRDGIVLSELRWRYEAPLRLKIDSKPAMLAISGQTGVMEANDYRGEPVLAAYTFIPTMEWGLVAKQDQSEVFAANRMVLLQTLVLLVLSGALVSFIAFIVSANIARPVAEMATVSRRIASGDLSARLAVRGKDELSFLGDSLNTMADAILSQMVVLEGAAQLNDVMVSADNRDDFRLKLLRKLFELTHSHLGACYGYNEELDRFEVKNCIGVNSGMLHPFAATDFQGELGRALETGSISKITGIPEDTGFVVKTFAGEALPKDILAIPVAAGGRIRLILAIASLTGYSEQDCKLVEHVWIGMGTALSSILGAEETMKLSKILYAKNMELEAQTQELLAQTEELQGQSEELQQQSEQLQQQNLELEIKTREVEEANRLKSEFLSNMSHELRTPLNSVMALSKVLILQGGEKLSEEELGYLAIIERNGRKLLTLINDILDLSKIEAGRIELKPKKLFLKAAIGDVVERLRPLAEEKGFELIEAVPEDLPRIETDEVRVDQVLQNIIANAVKFTEHGGVKVTAFADGDRVHIQVSDTGIGIPEEQLEHIFDEFHQVDGSASRHYEGTGLGLAIARKATELLGGQLSVESSLGTGSTFTLSLPIWWLGESAEAELFPMVRVPAIDSLEARKTVLVVDDDPTTVAIISNCLTEEGFVVLGATSGAEALEYAQRYLPFAITLDIIMPDMDGLEVIQALKSNPKTVDIPVIVVSVTGDGRTGMLLGAADYINKPVARDDLLRALGRLGKAPAHSLGVAHDDAVPFNRAVQGNGCPPSSQQASHLKRILIIEDNPDNLATIRAILSGSYLLMEAADGEAGLEIAVSERPDAILLDMALPKMDGYDVVKRIRAHEDVRHLPVIALTARAMAGDRDRILDAGCDDYVAKPIDPLELVEKVRAWLT